MDKQRILIVDDEIRMCESLEILLSGRGLDIKCFTDGRQALSYIQDQGCDLVLLDLLMPDMDGFNVLASIKENFPDVQVIIMTAQGSTDSAVKAIKGKADDFLCKPFEMDELTRRIQNALETRCLSRQNALIE
ncbi:MAG: response regulator, partial [Deltaproteobacteria bacterium]